MPDMTQWLIIQGRLPTKVLFPLGATIVDLLFLPDEEQQLHPEGCAFDA